MNYFPDFLEQGYRVNKELGSNRAGGRVTYLATDLATLEKVVIKQFQFARSNANWVDYDAYQREIEVLQGLDYPGIPRYLNSFHTKDGFCMVQEYKDALSLAITRSFSFHEIRQIAISSLKILAYLQNRIPPIIHRDVKPENILVSDKNEVYLVDFGFARVGEGEVGVSSVVKGTLGFMPPEQLFNRQLTEASDLYGLGMTLVCLLTGTKSTEIGNLVDISYRINFKHLLPKVNVHWVNWLEKMVEPRLKDRYANAATALAAIPQELIYLPEARFHQSKLELVATWAGETLADKIVINNYVPETLLEGEWQVAAHPHDPSFNAPHHAWIKLEPPGFVGNEIETQITINTSQLMPGKIYRREILLHTNCATKTYALALQVQTAAVKTRSQQRHFPLLAALFLISLLVTWTLAELVVAPGVDSFHATGFSAVTGASLGLEAAAWSLSIAGVTTGSTTGVIAGVLVGGWVLLTALTHTLSTSATTVVVGAVLGFLGGVITGIAAGWVAEICTRRGMPQIFAIALSLLTTATAAGIGAGLKIGFLHPPLLVLLVTTTLPLLAMVLYLPLNQIKLNRDRRYYEQHLIKP